MAVFKSSFYQRGGSILPNLTPNKPDFSQLKPVARTTPTPTPTSTYTQKPVASYSTPQLPPASQPNVNQNDKGKIFTGNLMERAFDVLRLPEYVGASFGKGYINKAKEQSPGKLNNYFDIVKNENIFSNLSNPKAYLEKIKAGAENVMPGVQTRTGLSNNEGDFNLAKTYGIENEAAQTGFNFGTSLLIPGANLGKLNKVSKFIPGTDKVSKAGNIVLNKARTTPAIYKTVEQVAPYFRNPTAGRFITDAKRTTEIRVSGLYNDIKALSKNLTPEQQVLVGKALEGTIKTTKDLAPIVAKARQLTLRVGKEAVDTGLLSAEAFAKNKNTYMTRIWDSGNKLAKVTKSRDVPAISGRFFKQRKGAEGYIQEFAPALFKGLGTEIRDVETAKLYQKLASELGQRIPKGKKASDLSMTSYRGIKNQSVAKKFKGMALPDEVVDYINRYNEKANPGFIGKAFDKFLKYWKPAKTIYNPAYHVRNTISNQILADMSTGKGLYRTSRDYIKSVKNYTGRGEQKFMDAAKKSGLVKNNSFFYGVNDLLQNAGFGKKSGIKKVLGKVQDTARGAQSFSEDTAKLSVFRTWIEKIAKEKGISVDKALKDKTLVKQAVDKTEEAIFSPYRISEAERSLVSRAIPFYSFTRQVAPFVAKTAVQNPSRLAKYPRFKDAVESLSGDGGVGQNDRPEYLKGQIRLPGKDAQGRDRYFDPSYIYPFGNFTQIGINDRGQLPFGLGINPLISEGMKQLTGYDPYTQQKVFDSNINELNTKERIGSALKMVSPAALDIAKNRVFPAFAGQDDSSGRTRSKTQAIVDAFGLRTTKIDPRRLRKTIDDNKKYTRYDIKNEIKKIEDDPNMSDSDKLRYIQELKGMYQ